MPIVILTLLMFCSAAARWVEGLGVGLGLRSGIACGKKERGPHESGILVRPHPGGKELGGNPPARDSTQSQAAWAFAPKGKWGFQVIGLLATIEDCRIHPGV
jgi:hypothetical protein